MLGDRHELDMREAHRGDIGRQLFGEFPISQPAVGHVRISSPRAEMDLIDRHRSIIAVDPRGGRRDRRERRRVDDHRGGEWAHLRRKGVRVRLDPQSPIGAKKLELVFLAGRHVSNKDFPKPVAAHPHGMPAAIPEVPVADNADAAGIGCEHAEGNAGNSLVHHRMGAELV